MKHQSFYRTVTIAIVIMVAFVFSTISDSAGAPPSRPGGGRPSSSPRPSSASRPGGRPSSPAPRQGTQPPRHNSSPQRHSQPPRNGGQVRPPAHNGNGPNHHDGGSRVTRRVTTNALTGKVIKDERFGNDSPIRRTYSPDLIDRPGLPHPYPGRHPGYNHGFYPPPPPPHHHHHPGYYPYSPYPLLPAYPPPPIGFPPPPAFWPGFIVNGVTVWANSSVPVYSNVQQIGLFGVYDSMGVRSGSLLMYFNQKDNLLGGYFNPAGTKYTRSVEGIVSNVNGVPTAMFTVNDQFKTQCAVPMNQLLGGASASGVMTIPNQGLDGATPEASTFTLQRIK